MLGWGNTTPEKPHSTIMKHSPQNLTAWQKREYLRLMITEGKEAARAYLENVICEGGVFFYTEREEADAFSAYLETCCPDGMTGNWFFIPNKHNRIRPKEGK